MFEKVLLAQILMKWYQIKLECDCHLRIDDGLYIDDIDDVTAINPEGRVSSK